MLNVMLKLELGFSPVWNVHSFLEYEKKWKHLPKTSLNMYVRNI